LQTTRYFEEQVLRKRPYLSVSLCEQVIAAPIARTTQDDGRIRLWGHVVDPRDGQVRVLRVILLEDDATLHNAFFDRSFRQDSP
jgi:hypothetical protein